MRKESLKKNSSNGVTEDAHVDNDAENNVGAGNDADDADPLLGADQPALEIPKKKGRKKNDTVTEVPVPVANNDGDDGSYEVEDIIDHKFEKKVRHFLVRWKNCTSSDDTWEPESSLDCPDIVQKYLENNPTAEEPTGSSRKRSAAKEKSTDIPAKRSRAKNATSNDGNGDAANGDEEYEVDDIVDHKIVRGKTSFLIRWKNYDASGDTWEPESSLSCPEIIARYREEHMKDVEVKPKREKSTKPKQDKSEKEYEVQLIYDEKIENGVKHYLVRWKGYKMDDDTWEPEDSLNCPDLISKYQESKKNKRTSGVRGTPKKLTYAEVEETEGEDHNKIYVNGSKSKSKSKAKATKGKKGAAAKGKPAKPAKPAKKEEEDYEVEDIVGEKLEKGKKYYFLKWKGWPSSSNTWELATSLSCPDVLKRYKSQQQDEPSTKSTPKKAAAASKSAKKPTKTTAASKKKSPAKKSKTTSRPAKAKPATKAAKKQVIDDAEQDWEVEKIVDVQYNEDGSKNFLIRWKGCDSSQDTWEPEDNVDSPDLIEAFMSRTDTSDEVVPKKKSRKA